MKISIILSSILLTSNILLADKMKSYADSVVLSVSNPTTMSLRDKTVLHGGGVSIQAPIQTLTPINIRTPSIKAGCGGIDLTFGSLSFLSGDQMVAFAENIMAAAPGVAFDLALKAVCPSCADTLKALEELANQINQMSMDSCGAAKYLMNSASSAIFGNTKSDMNKGGSDDWLKGFNDKYIRGATNFLKDFNNELNSLGYNQKFLKFFTEGSENSYIVYAFEHNSFFNSTLMERTIRSIAGDLIITQRPQSDKGGTVQYINTIEKNLAKNENEKTNTQKILMRLMGDEKYSPILVTKNRDQIRATNNNFPAGKLIESYKKSVKNILNKFSTRQALTNKDIEFLSYFRDPIYKIFNIGASSFSGLQLLQSTSDELATMLASQVTYEMIIQIHMLVSKDLYEFDTLGDEQMEKLPYNNKDQIKKYLQKMTTNTRYAASEAYVIYSNAHKKFVNKLGKKQELIRNMQRLKDFTVSRLNPDLFFNYTIAGALSGKQ